MHPRIWVHTLSILLCLTLVAPLNLDDYYRIAGIIDAKGTSKGQSYLKQTIEITVKTEDVEEAGTEANVWVVLGDTTGAVSKPFLINNRATWRPLQRNEINQYDVPIPDNFATVYEIKIFRDHSNNKPDWFCDYIFVKDNRLPKDNEYFFPIDRFIEDNQLYEFENYATYLPQFDPNPGPRKENLVSKRQKYQYTYQPYTAAMVKELPKEEQFSPMYLGEIGSITLNNTALASENLKKWEASGDLNDAYGGQFFLPDAADYWWNDKWFAAMRLQGINPIIIKHIKRIPQNFGVTEQTVSGLLDHYTLHQALNKNKIFICDLTMLHDIPYKEEKDKNHAAPLALFYLNNKNHLMPVAIQLKAHKGPNNPVYTPKDPANTWRVAKLFYNNAEAQHHQALAHFGYTHTIMDGIAVASNRHLSPSHPVYKLLKPHFLFLMAIDKFALERVFNNGGRIELFTMGQQGLHSLLAKYMPEWTIERSIGSVEREMASRGVLDPNILPYYPYRDDALALNKIIKKYVSTVLKYYYDHPSKISGDLELKKWRDELCKSRTQNGVGIPDLPGTRHGFRNVNEVIEFVTFIITTNSMGHAAVNFQQYDIYGFQVNYPALLRRPPPTRKRHFTESEIVEQLLSTKQEHIFTMFITNLLSWQGTNDLGDFEKRYLYDPLCIEAEQQLQQDLGQLSLHISQLNRNRLFPYRYQDPERVPNSIAI